MNFKQKIKNHLNKIRNKKFAKKKITNPDVTILCNCCIGGAMYHDLGMRFLSPTINLYFAHHCFIDYVNNLERYSKNGTLVDSGKLEKTNNAPIGYLICDELPLIEIHFLHYQTFEEAKEKWNERTKRINYENIFLVIEAKAEHEHSLVDEYNQLPYKKIIFSNLSSDKSKSLKHMRFYDTHPKGNITSFVGVFGKKGYDDFDFVKEIFN